MKPKLLAYALLVVLLAHAAAVLCFHYFITIDGPMHVLHASLLRMPWATPDHAAQGYTYVRGLRCLGDVILAVLLGFFTPERTHVLYAVLLGCGLVFVAVAFLRAHGTGIGVPVLWLAPILFNTLLFLGLFHFLLGVLLCLGSVTWWKWYQKRPTVRWVGLMVGAALAWATHRGAPLLLCVLFLPSFVMEIRNGHTYKLERRSRVKWFAIGTCILLVGAIQFQRVLTIIDAPMPSSIPVFDHAFLLKTLFIVDRSREAWFVLGIGLLLLISMVACGWARWQCGKRPLWHDTLLILFLLLLAVAWISNSPHGRRLVISDRAHWLALLSLVLWLIAMSDHVRGAFARLVGVAAVCALPLNAVRLVQAERAFATLERPHRSIMEACAVLEPNSMVLSVTAGTDRYQQHVEAYVAMEHSGIVIAPRLFLLSSGPFTVTNVNDWQRFSRDPNWLIRHWRRGIPPEVEQIMFMGRNIEERVGKHPWPVLLGDHFRLSFENEQARIYTAVTRSTASSER